MVLFVGRTVERDAIRAALRERAGILVAGEAGSGRSRLLTEATAALETSRTRVCRISGVETEVPYGAFAHLLPGSPGPVNPIRWAADIVAGDLPLILAVDDAHLLDPRSAALVRHLVVHRGARLVATTLSGTDLPRPITSLWKDGLVSRLDLRPLSPQDSARLAAAMLGGPVEELTARRLWHATRGNVSFLVEIISSGSFTQTGGVWWWRGELVLSERLRTLAETGLGRLDEAEREVLEFVALGEPLDLDALVTLTSPDAVEGVERRGLVTVVPHGSRLRVRLAHPIHGQIIRSWCGPVRTRNRLERVVRLRGPDEGTGGAELSARELEIARLASWNLTNREIAGWLTLSPRTVANHLCRVYTKLGVNDRKDLALLLV
ncbi:LuxR C-terminal-related transcriptional regulator [Microbispora sp. NPDC049125]|uniref:LuxR C-terminal-related transcriptional regulator n=1 Tax=Microbispora sp. NPDC049125 TaxID=3154929 RepID=UPI0034663439